MEGRHCDRRASGRRDKSQVTLVVDAGRVERLGQAAREVQAEAGLVYERVALDGVLAKDLGRGPARQMRQVAPSSPKPRSNATRHLEERAAEGIGADTPDNLGENVADSGKLAGEKGRGARERVLGHVARPAALLFLWRLKELEEGEADRLGVVGFWSQERGCEGGTHRRRLR